MIVAPPSLRHARGVSRDGAEDAGPEEVGEVMVLGPGSRRVGSGRAASIRACGGVDGRPNDLGDQAPTLVWRTADGPTRLSARSSTAWTTRTLEGVGDPIPVVFTVGERTLLGFDRGDARVEIGELRSQPEGDLLGWRRLATLDADLPRGDRAIVGTVAGPWVVGVAGSTVEVVRVDPVTGASGPLEVAVEATGAGSLVHLPIPFLVLFASIVATIVLRPLIDRTSEAPVVQVERAALFRRAAAVCIDLVPGAMLSVVVFDLDPAVFQAAIRDGAAESYPPAIFAILFTGVLAAVVETIWDRSLGKAIVGLKVVDGHGGPATRLQQGLRAGLKINVLFMPLIAVIAAVDPQGRGLPELATRTLVCPARPSPRPGADLDA